MPVNIKIASIAFFLMLVQPLALARKSAMQAFYPGIDRFFNSLSTVKLDTAHINSLNKLKAVTKIAMSSERKIDVLFTCPDNSFRSQAAQIILSSLAAIKGFSKLHVFSAGYNETDIDPRLILLLKQAGYKVKRIDGGSYDHVAYSIKFSSAVEPLVVFAKNDRDPTLPLSFFQTIKACAETENCPDIRGSLYTTELPFANPISLETPQLEAEFRSIAADIYLTVKSIKP